MEQSLSSFTYKGSIPEAITEAKKQRKLFVVYISGKNDESSRLENSTWTDRKVADSVAKYCILLHISEESCDAANFAAIYPQKPVPCITAIGYNGVQLWQNEGFVSAEVLRSNLEKAWLGVHLQETTATVLSAALASNKSEPSTSGVPNTISTEKERSSNTAAVSDQGSSSSTVIPLPLKGTKVKPPDTIDVSSGTVKETKGHDCIIEEKCNDLGYETSSKSFDARGLECIGNEQPSSSTNSAQGVQGGAMEGLKNSGGDNISSIAEGGYSVAEKTTASHSAVSGEGSQAFSNVKNEVVQVERSEIEDDKMVDTFENNTRENKSSDAHFNIRLLDGVSLKQKFSVTSTMRMVKDYVDENQGTDIGSYDLAIPYPRRVFCDQDLSKSLSDLGLFDRQALIVVPHQKGTSYLNGRSAFSDQRDTRKILVKFGTTIPKWHLGTCPPNPNIGSNSTQSTSTSGRNEGKKSRKIPASGFGSNIHTLKHDEDDERFSNKNAFWNGNSTQYGGNDDGK